MGRALVVGGAQNRAQPIQILQRLYGFECAEADDPYSAMLELCRRKTVYNALILSLASMYREELGLIATVKRRFPHLEVWLTHTDGRQADLAQAMRLGSDGLLGDEGLHRVAPLPAAQETQVHPQMVEQTGPLRDQIMPVEAGTPDVSTADEHSISEPVLTADELRALLQDQPSMPPAGNPPDA